MEIKKESEKREIKNSIEAPTVEAGASRSEEMVIEHEERDSKAEQELQDLAIGDEAFPGRSNTDGGEEVVRVHDDVDGGVGEEGDREERLGSMKPEEGHEEDGGVVVEVEEREAAEGTREKDEESVE